MADNKDDSHTFSFSPTMSHSNQPHQGRRGQQPSQTMQTQHNDNDFIMNEAEKETTGNVSTSSTSNFSSSFFDPSFTRTPSNWNTWGTGETALEATWGTGEITPGIT
jgi:hypothetical protein